MNNKPTAVVAQSVQREPASVDSFITQALNANVPIETMEKLFAMKEKHDAAQAKAAFVQALADFQHDCPKIAKTKKVMNKDGRSVRYQYAPLDTIIEQAKGALAKHGLSYRWETKNEQGFITAVATVTHILGHSESSEFKVPIDTEGFMTAPQKYASALTFAKRYSLCNALGISTGDEDTDATDVKKEASVKSDKSKIMFLLRRLGHEPKAKEDKAKKQEIEKAVEKMAQLKLVDENFNEIVLRLEALVLEKEEYEKSQAA
jgi:ERF superfamily protein